MSQFGTPEEARASRSTTEARRALMKHGPLADGTLVALNGAVPMQTAQSMVIQDPRPEPPVPL
ncbi:hypothetical protein AWB82_05581 [Caballeronia glebae]|jgi:hypothetical protein|uniref:Uncharacterized protein n=1 Tax=Caballeronia glebae TaxID=1777143 RepID=A0A158CLZ6_9BURK|nr:hypothetical protein AWB82_05581 [Caballeronia glebae]